MNPDKKKDLHELLAKGNIAFYDYQEKQLPDSVSVTGKRMVRVLGRQKPGVESTKNVKVSSYSGLSEIRKENADVCFLDHQAKKVLFTRFSIHSQFILVRFLPRSSWFVALPGVIHYLLRKEAFTYQGVVTLTAGSRKQRWVVLENRKGAPLSGTCLSSEVGVQGFLDFLNKEKISYVVLRFFDNLPDLGREGGDLDVLVADKDKPKVEAFLAKNKGEIRIDLYDVTSLDNKGLPYYPPHLSRKILETSVEGPAHSQVPNPKEAFLSLAYHALYHKGIYSGIPSGLKNINVVKDPENNYTKKLSDMAHELGITVTITMELLDEYLAKEGWRPNLDTLAKIAIENEWVRRRFFIDTKEKEIGLAFFVLKKKAVTLNLVDPIIEEIKRNGFLIVKKKEIEKDRIPYVTENLRGGNWTMNVKNEEDFLPQFVVVALDAHAARLSKVTAIPNDMNEHIRALKIQLRKKFDQDNLSVIHSTDNTRESWEYVDVCFEKDSSAIRKAIQDEYVKLKPSLTEKCTLFFKLIPYRFRMWKRMTREKLVRTILGE